MRSAPASGVTEVRSEAIACSLAAAKSMATIGQRRRRSFPTSARQLAGTTAEVKPVFAGGRFEPGGGVGQELAIGLQLALAPERAAQRCFVVPKVDVGGGRGHGKPSQENRRARGHSRQARIGARRRREAECSEEGPRREEQFRGSLGLMVDGGRARGDAPRYTPGALSGLVPRRSPSGIVSVPATFCFEPRRGGMGQPRASPWAGGSLGLMVDGDAAGLFHDSDSPLQGESPMATRITWLGHACLLLETDGRRLLIDPFFTDNPAADQGRRSPGRLHPGVARPRRPRRRHDRHRQANRRHGRRQLRNRRLVRRSRALEKVHGMQHGGGFQFPFGRRQADAGVPRLDAARRQLRRQPVRLSASPATTAKRSTTRPTPACSAT